MGAVRVTTYPPPCCVGAVVVHSGGQAFHSFGIACDRCTRLGARMARYDAATHEHICPRCDPDWKGLRS